MESVRCNLVIHLDLPDDFGSYAHRKVKAKSAPPAWNLFFCGVDKTDSFVDDLAKFTITERKLKMASSFQDPTRDELVKADAMDRLHEPYAPKIGSQESEKTSSVTLSTAIPCLNRYCAKLPSDTFTRLTALCSTKRIGNSSFVSVVQLPINSPLKEPVYGRTMPSEVLAKRSAALEACKRLHGIKELDDSLIPTGKDSLAGGENVPPPKLPALTYDMKTGTAKRRQFYYKQTATSLTPATDEKPLLFQLYSIKLALTCPIPDDQNTRGRKIYSPEDALQSFGFLVQREIAPVCPFPIYTRSGEVMVEIVEMKRDMELGERDLDLIRAFHKYVFSKVLRLEKYPMMFDPNNSDNCVQCVPLTSDGLEIDWRFLGEIHEAQECNRLVPVSDEDREEFCFDPETYEDAVVMPWYRNRDQPQYFYVAEICRHLSPKSDFPGQGFETFEKYYEKKYSIRIRDLDQPLLDVDHTSARLNFLTPRYVNRKGVALPTSTEETRKNKRENLDQKQILVPELCSVHPFRASLWRQTVSLPCIFYRLNSLLLADQIRVLVSNEVGLGRSKVDDSHRWEALNFGWTLSEVLKNRESDSITSNLQQQQSNKRNKIRNSSANLGSLTLNEDDVGLNPDKIDSLSEKLINEINAEDKKLKKKSLEIGTWSNEMAENIEEIDRDDDDEDDLELYDPNIALPDNLTLISNDNLPSSNLRGRKGISSPGNRRDWGTGIEQKRFQVGSPTFFDNPNINIPGLMDDDSDFSDDDIDMSSEKSDGNEQHESGERIEFRGNLAEAIEDKEEEKKRSEVIAKHREEDERMVEAKPWDSVGDVRPLAQEEISLSKAELLKANLIIRPDETFCKKLVSKEENKNPTAMKCDIQLPNEEDYNDLMITESAKLEMLTSLTPFAAVNATIDELCRKEMPDAPTKDNPTFSFDLQPDLSSHPGPPPSLILHAITMSNSNDAINLERLETIGDSFLKYAITAYLFCTYPTTHEGKLSHLRSKQVSNLHLYHLGKEKRLGEFMIATKFEPHDNWLPPGFHIPKDLEQALIESGVPATHWNMAELPGIDRMAKEDIYKVIQEKATAFKSSKVVQHQEQGQEEEATPSIEDAPSFIPYNLLTQHSIPDKSIADCVEALIGSYLISCGPRGAQLFMTWLGLEVLPPGNEGLLPPAKSPLLDTSPSGLAQLEVHLCGYDAFEDLIGYRFHDRSYLLQALSHASYYPNRLTDCYQRLEFLGDAVLDYLITRYLYEDPRKHSPGALTDLRSALVNNTMFASLAVKFQYHKFFKHFSPGLQTVINRYRIECTREL